MEDAVVIQFVNPHLPVGVQYFFRSNDQATMVNSVVLVMEKGYISRFSQFYKIYNLTQAKLVRCKPWQCAMKKCKYLLHQCGRINPKRRAPPNQFRAVQVSFRQFYKKFLAPFKFTSFYRLAIVYIGCLPQLTGNAVEAGQRTAQDNGHG